MQPGCLPLFKWSPEHGAWLAGQTRPHGLAGAAAGLALLWPISPGCLGAEGPQDAGAKLTVNCRFSALEVAPRGISVSVGARALESAFLTSSQ